MEVREVSLIKDFKIISTDLKASECQKTVECGSRINEKIPEIEKAL